MANAHSQSISTECLGEDLTRLMCEWGVSADDYIIFGFAIAAFVWFLFSEWRLLGTPGNPAFQSRIDKLRERGFADNFADNYRARLSRWLNVADSWFGQPTPATPGSLMDRLFGCNPFTARSYERLLNLAFVYPVAFLTAGSFISNNDYVVALSILLLVFGFYFTGLWIRQRIDRIDRIWIRAVAIAIPVSLAVASAVTFAGALALAFAVAFAVATLRPFFYSPIQQRDVRVGVSGRFLFWMVLFIFTTTAGVIISTQSNEVSSVALILVVFPLVNAPLDWLSVGITRGLLKQIAIGNHDSISALRWAGCDIILAFLLLLAVATSCLIGVLVVNAIGGLSNGALTVIVFLDVLKGNQSESSFGIWLMLGTTLLPTFLHFLIALWAFFVLPFSRKDANITANSLQEARNEVLRRVVYDTNQPADAIPIDTDARRKAFIFLCANRLVMGGVFLLWLVAMAGICWLLFTVLTTAFVFVIEWLT